MKHQYIDSQKLDEIFSQLHLLTAADIVCVLLVAACDKVVKVYCYNGIQMYFTDRKAKRTVLSWSSEDFKKFAKVAEQTNQCYDEAYISVFVFAGERYFVEHNETFDADEIGRIIGFVSGALSKMNLECSE